MIEIGDNLKDVLGSISLIMFALVAFYMARG